MKHIRLKEKWPADLVNSDDLDSDSLSAGMQIRLQAEGWNLPSFIKYRFISHTRQSEHRFPSFSSCSSLPPVFSGSTAFPSLIRKAQASKGYQQNIRKPRIHHIGVGKGKPPEKKRSRGEGRYKDQRPTHLHIQGSHESNTPEALVYMQKGLV